MRPMCSNNREVSMNHWSQETIPLQGFLVYFSKNNLLHKKIVYVTAPSTSSANWSFTSLAFLEVMKHMLPIMGSIRHLIAVVDGAASQVHPLYKL